MAKTILHKADSRGHANHGWLDTYHTFSFASYFDRSRMNFGALRVLNDDYIAGGMGFDFHPHDNMEIITIPQVGALEHRDSMGNTEVISKGEIQVMSAGTGILHSEYNHNKDEECRLLQIWVLPDKTGVKPRYDQIPYNLDELNNKFLQIVSPEPEDEGSWIHQNAWFHLGKFGNGIRADYKLKAEGNGVYAFIIEGSADINGTKLERRDGLGLWELDELYIRTESDYTEILLMEVPMII
ncbi:MAG: hypothetical protein HW421_3538 [Ignavibacteria bacterium]|nr:hypothetical protein [Ignavibacteria bacterium]